MNRINTIENTDALSGLKLLDSESIDCCITSPPYFGLRDYKVEGQVGLEKTFDEYIDKLIQIFNQVKRVLKKTGSCWVVMGDTYNGSKNGNTQGTGKSWLHGNNSGTYLKEKVGVKKAVAGIADKSLLLIPERFAMKMIDNGWILRNKLIWHKNNCMPSSAKDRFTIDYEFIYFFTKSEKYYFKTQYEPYSEATLKEFGQIYNGKGIKDYEAAGVQNPSDVKRRIIAKFPIGGVKHVGRNFRSNDLTYSGNPWNPVQYGRIARTVWRINTKPFKEAHFAVFPQELVRKMIDPGCPPDGICLDPFMGAGTVALVALKMNRSFIGFDLNKEYVEMANKRINPYLHQMKIDIGIE